MYDGKQVVRLETQYKSSDLYNIGKEMEDRKGTGNYDKNRTEYNYVYVPLTERNLYQQVKKTLKDRNIEYLNRPNTNMLNGITFTSGTEFFEALGMQFIDSGRTYKTGNKKGQVVKVPYIKSMEDIPQTVRYYFDSCMDYLKELVGEENIILAQVHYDEDTPHLQAYFLPIVNEVKRKCFEKDKNGNTIKIETKNKIGDITLVPKLMRDEKGSIIYETIKGKFLNNDQFWKSKGGKNSYARVQDSFHKFITERGFKLDRGKVGSNIEHQTKLEYQINEYKAELEELKQEKDYSIKEIENSKNTLLEAHNSANKDILNPKRNITGYNTKEVDKLIAYSKDLEKIKVIQDNELSSKNITIQKLQKENDGFKNNEEIKKRNTLIVEQKDIIKEQKQEIKKLENVVDILSHNIESLKYKLEQEIDKWKKLVHKLCKALDKVLHREPKRDLEDYEDLADSINYGYSYTKSKDKDDMEIGL